MGNKYFRKVFKNKFLFLICKNKKEKNQPSYVSCSLCARMFSVYLILTYKIIEEHKNKYIVFKQLFISE